MTSVGWAKSAALIAALAGALVGACSSSGGGNDGFGDGGSGSRSKTRGPDGSVLTLTEDTGVGKLGATGSDGSQPSYGDAQVATGAPHGCDPTCEAAGGTCSNKVCTITENPGNVTAAAQQQLGAAGTSDPTFTWLYPYEATVFPRGLISPTLQFGGTAPEAIMVQMSYSSLSYTGYFAGTATPRAQISAAAWAAVTEGAWASDVVTVNVTKLAGGKVSGPITEHWSVAQGSLRGQIYYETYGSPLAGGPDSVGIMSIAPGASAPTVLKKGCGNVCHTASADGSTLVANVSLGFSSASYDLKTSASTIKLAGGLIFTYGGLYPDGSFLMSATNYRTWTGGKSRLYNTTTGANIPAPGWDGVITNGGTTAFSPDGTRLAFIREDLDQGMGSTLAMMDFDKSSYTFSNLTNLTVDTGMTIGWPAFTPDTKTVVYHVGTNQNFETDGGAQGNVFQVDLTTHAAARLDALDGYTTTGSTYLPANDPDLNFAPTVLPEAVGGYFWAVFTSHRSYGNTLPTQDNGDQNGKLWVAALDLTDTPGKDSSHPAFYLDGQESAADNLRGFWVLPPCKSTGSGCQTGDQCCTGYCSGTSTLTCTGEVAGACSNEYEKCATNADCCGSSAGYECIGGFCAQPAPPPVGTPK